MFNMTGAHKAGHTLLRLSWLGLMIWQLLWHALLPAPVGSNNWILAVIALIPLLPFTKGVMKINHASLMWGAFLIMIYFSIGVMETWSNADQRLAAIIQIVLSCAYFSGVILANRRIGESQD